jgi:hypothetical protein
MSMIDEIKAMLAKRDMERYLQHQRAMIAATRRRPAIDPWLLVAAFVMGLAAGVWIGVSL